MDKTPFGFPQPTFMRKKSTLEKTSGPVIPFSTHVVNPSPRKPPHTETTKSRADLEELASQEPGLSSPFSNVFQRTFNSPTVVSADQSFSPSNAAAEFPFNTPRRKPTTTFVGKPLFPGTPIKTPSPRAPLEPAISLSMNEVEESLIRRPQSRASLPSFFRRPFTSPSSECGFTPKRGQMKAEMGREDSSSTSSSISYNEANGRRLPRQSLFGQSIFSRGTSVNSEQLPTESTKSDGQQGEDESPALEADNVSEHLGFYQYQYSETMDGEEPYFEEGEKKTDLNWAKSTKSDESKTSLESQLQAFTVQLLAAAEEAQSNVKAENASLKKELSRSQQHIVYLEAQFNQLERNRSEAIRKTNHLSLEKETICDSLRNLQEQMSAVEEELGKRQDQCEEMNLQLASKEQRLNVALDNVKSLEELTRSSNERICDLQAQLQLVSTERIVANEKIATMSEEVNMLNENFVSLESAMSNAESKFQSTLNDYKDQQEKLEKEITCYQETESALYNARSEYNTVKGELQSCIEELAKTKEDFNAVLEENRKLEERIGRLNEKYATCEQSTDIARENICSLEKAISNLQAEIQQLNQHLETSCAELINSKEEAANLRKENEALHCQLNSYRNHLTAHDEKFQLELTRKQQELSCEKEAHSETKKSAMTVLSETRNILETHIKELQGNLIVADSEKGQKKRELDDERATLSDEETCWKLCKNQLEAYFDLLSAESHKVQSTIETLNGEINSRKCQINDLQEIVGMCEGQIESITRELQIERAAHTETKTSWEQCKDQLETDRKEHFANLSKVQDTLQELNDTKSSLEAQVGNLEGNLVASQRQNETIKQELCSERDAHRETMSNWKFCKEQLGGDQHQHSVDLSRLQSAMQIISDQKKFADAQVTDLQSKLVSTVRNHESIREKNLSLERQLEYASIEISTLRAEVRDHANRNHELQALLDSVRTKSALSGDSFEAALNKCRKELDSQQETQRETMRSLAETCFKLRSAEDICDQALRDRTKLQSDVVLLTKEKLESEDTVMRLETKINSQEKNIDAITACNASLNQTLGVYEDYVKEMHQKCQLMFAENSEAATNAKELAVEIKALTGNFQMIQKNAQIVDEDFKDFNIWFGKLIEMTTASSMEIQNRMATANARIASSNETLQKAETEKSMLENTIHVASAEKAELEKQIEMARENSLASQAVEKQLRNRITALDDMKTSSDKQIVDLEERVRSVEAELTLSYEKVIDLQNDKVGLETQLDSLHRQLEAAQYKCENATGVFTAEKEKLQEQVKALTEATANWKSTNEKFCTRNAALKSSLIASGQQISDLHQRVNSLDTEFTLSKEKVKDLAVEKTNLESQLGSLRHQLKESREKYNRDVEKLRHQLDTEKALNENFRSRVGVIPRSPHQQMRVTNERKQKSHKAIAELKKRPVDDNNYASGPRNEVPVSPLTIQNEILNSRPLNDHQHQLQTEKESHKNKANFGSSSGKLSPINRSRDTLNDSSKITDVDKRGDKKFANDEENKPVIIIEESPPAVARKTRRAAAAAATNRSFPIQFDLDGSPSSNGSCEQSKTQTPDEASVCRERRKLVLTPVTSTSYVPSPSPTRNSTSTKATPAKGDQEAVADSDANESLAAKFFPSTRKTYARKRLSMTARLVSANTVTTQPYKKPRRVTK